MEIFLELKIKIEKIWKFLKNQTSMWERAGLELTEPTSWAQAS